MLIFSNAEIFKNNSWKSILVLQQITVLQMSAPHCQINPNGNLIRIYKQIRTIILWWILKILDTKELNCKPSSIRQKRQNYNKNHSVYPFCYLLNFGHLSRVVFCNKRVTCMALPERMKQIDWNNSHSINPLGYRFFQHNT